MNHSPHCIPCVLRRVLSMSNLVTADEWLQRKILGETMVALAHADDTSTPPEVMHGVYRRTARTLGSADPYAEEKRRWREEILANAASIRERIAGAPDPFAAAVTAAIAANVVDDELREGTTLKRLLGEIDQAELDPGPIIDELRDSVRGAASILFVHDSVGELYFDRLLIEEMLRAGPPGARCVSVVRSANALGDATREDAVALGLDEVAEIVDPGLECLGLPISECSAEFRELFRQSDLVVAKGQAAYQTLEADGRTPDGNEKEVWFLFRIKCPVMARQLAASIGDLFLERN
jgi:hypothetical protein